MVPITFLSNSEYFRTILEWSLTLIQSELEYNRKILLVKRYQEPLYRVIHKFEFFKEWIQLRT